MERRSASVAHCLGQPAHALPDTTIICPVCHCLRENATIGQYQVLQRLGKGRSGDAYVVRHLQLQQLAILKLFPADRGSRPLWEAARREIRAVTALRHPALLPVFQCVIWNQPMPLQTLANNPSNEGAQEYLLTFCQFAPLSLAQIVDRKSQIASALQMLTPEPLTWAMGLVAAIGDSLSLMHSSGIVHGALGPGNILSAPGQYWLADFGLASLHPPLPPYLAPELESEVHYAYRAQDFVPIWRARNPTHDQYALAIVYKRLFAIILPQAINDRIAPILQKAAHANPVRRFESIHQLTQTLLERLKQPSLPARQDTTSVSRDSAVIYSAREEDWEGRGNSAFRANNYEVAVQAYQQALTLSPQKPALWAALGDSFFALGQNKEAVDAYGKALRLNPMLVDIWINRGTALEQLGRSQEAAACYERAAQLQDQGS